MDIAQPFFVETPLEIDAKFDKTTAETPFESNTVTSTESGVPDIAITDVAAISSEKSNLNETELEDIDYDYIDDTERDFESLDFDTDSVILNTLVTKISKLNCSNFNESNTTTLSPEIILHSFIGAIVTGLLILVILTIIISIVKLVKLFN
jgi:hypothetical protein